MPQNAIHCRGFRHADVRCVKQGELSDRSDEGDADNMKC